MAQIWIQHLGLVGGPVEVSQEQFDDIYQALGWTVTTAPTGLVGRSPSELLHFAGDWQPSTVYQANDVVRAPDGGLIRYYQQQTTDTTFAETGAERLVTAGAGGGGSGSILSF
jgi:hypothetical protein